MLWNRGFWSYRGLYVYFKQLFYVYDLAIQDIFNSIFPIGVKGLLMS